MATNSETQKIVWLDKDLHRTYSIEAARNGMRVGKYINKILRDLVEEKNIKE